jgi:hypothetical protein
VEDGPVNLDDMAPRPGPRLRKQDVPADQAYESTFPDDHWVRLDGTDVEVLWFERSGIRWLQHRRMQ